MKRHTVESEEWSAALTEVEQLRLLVRCAVLAPSGHNTQPWLFRVADDALELHADRTRALPVVDPDDRELTMSCGAALAHVVVAAEHFGRVAEVTTLPDSSRPDLLARVTLGVPTVASERSERRFEALGRRRTDRGPYVHEPVPSALLDGLSAAAREEGAWLAVVTDDARKAALGDLVVEGDRIQMGDRRFRRELASWIHPNRTRQRDGLPGFVVGVTNDFVSEAAPLVLRLFDTGKGLAERDRALAEGSPALLLLGTEDDTPGEWLKAGRALATLWLDATAAGLSLSFLNQPIELPELRRDVAELGGRAGFPQLLVRIGRSEGSRDPRLSPRRPVGEVLLE